MKQEMLLCICHLILRRESQTDVTNGTGEGPNAVQFLQPVTAPSARWLLSQTDKKEPMKTNAKPLLIAGFVALSALFGGIAQAATPYANATVEGALAPGVYGRIEIGNAPPPPLLYTQPVIIQRAPVYVQQQPMYLHVPPGHAKKWSKHCARYNACNRPVYFVRVDGDDRYEQRRARQVYSSHENDQGRYYGNEHDNKHAKKHGKEHGGGHGNGHGKGHNKD